MFRVDLEVCVETVALDFDVLEIADAVGVLTVFPVLRVVEVDGFAFVQGHGFLEGFNRILALVLALQPDHLHVL